MVRRRWNVVLERTVRELQGFACIELEDEPPPRKEIACTRSFGYPVRALKDLAEAVTDFVSRAAEKLRAQDHHACRVLVFIHTSPFRRGEPQYSKAITVPLRLPTSDTAQLVRAALHGLRVIYREGYNFSKAGIHLLELEPANVEQKELPLDESPHGRDELMTAMDRINAKYGHGSLYLASAGTAGARREWLTRRSLKTPEYTTRLADLPVAVL
jgi:DNA polymerase V